MNIAAKVAKHKQSHPNLYCPQAKCLWKTGGGKCPRHNEKEEALMHTESRVYLSDLRGQ